MALFREGVGRLLAEVQRIKAEGDFVAAKRLFDRHGIHFDPKLRDQVIERVKATNPPSYTGFVMPQTPGRAEPDGRHHRRDDLVPEEPDDADAGVRGGHQSLAHGLPQRRTAAVEQAPHMPLASAADE